MNDASIFDNVADRMLIAAKLVDEMFPTEHITEQTETLLETWHVGCDTENS